MCGLNPSSGKESAVGFRHAWIAPKPNKTLQWARARYRSAVGFYESGWRIDEADQLTIEIAIPFNASARVVLPNACIDGITINGHPSYEGEQMGESVELTLGAGHHKIEYLFQEKNILA